MNTQNNNANLKQQVKSYWNRASCGTGTTQQQKFSQAYFEEIERHRYSIEADIFALAQFTRFHGKKVLEVGMGAGTDFLQWVRSGAQAYGIDLTQESIDNVTARLDVYGLKAVDIRVADAEAIPHPNNFFDCVYSWGVIHHSPDMEQCLREIIRVTRPGGTIKLMVYNRRSLVTFYLYLRTGLLKGKPFQSFANVLFHHQESLGTKAYTHKEIRKMTAKYPVVITQLKSTVAKRDLLDYKRKPYQWLAYWAACLFGMNKVGWFMTIELTKKEETI